MKLFEIFKTSSKDTPKDSTDGQEVAVAQKGETNDIPVVIHLNC